MGVFMAKILPTRKFKTFGWEWSFNPGPFSLKEHVLISIMGSSGAAGAYGIENVNVQKFKKVNKGPAA